MVSAGTSLGVGQSKEHQKVCQQDNWKVCWMANSQGNILENQRVFCEVCFWEQSLGDCWGVLQEIWQANSQANWKVILQADLLGLPQESNLECT